MSRQSDSAGDRHHHWMMNFYRRAEEHDRVICKIARPERCPHCGERLDAPRRTEPERPGPTARR